MSLHTDRARLSRLRQRPDVCQGCSGNPDTPGHNPLYNGAFIPPSGPLDADILLVGISGGEEEEVRGENLVGPSGRKLIRGLRWGGGGEGHRLSFRKYNVRLCRAVTPAAVKAVKNRAPSVKEMRECCSRFLFPELQKTRCKLVLVLGLDVYKFLFKASEAGHYQFDVFKKAMGHRLLKPQRDIGPDSLGRRIVSYGKVYEV